ncbi:MAG: radical SAM protein [Candidatus Bathyarchaeota archaeon]|nr:radical SAM protein [Candidatus Bathyarchaeum sp.]
MLNKTNILRNFLRSRVHTAFDRKLLNPLFLNFECTYRCNMKCSFCNIWRKSNSTNEASTTETKNKLLECWDLGCLILGITGGEPLLREDINEILQYSSSIGLITGLVTNGILLDKKIDAISKYCELFAVSFDVNDKQTFNRTRGVNAFDTVKKNIELATRMGLEINLLSVITSETFEFIDQTIEFAKSLDQPIHFSSVDNVPREFVEKSESETLKIKETNKILEKLAEEKKKYKKIHFERDYFRFQTLGGFNRFIRCSSASTSIALKPDASVALPCPFFTLMTIKKEEKLKESLSSEKARKIIKDCGKFNFCKYCSINCMYVVSLIKHPNLLIRWVQDKI